ncbi:Uncharacterised protein [Mycobacteroides abscessus subsp. massiliense]|nr:Uncharacterised protein [Mycobacteroides abscessus subsp. massiliense]
MGDVHGNQPNLYVTQVNPLTLAGDGNIDGGARERRIVGSVVVHQGDSVAEVQ